MEDLHEMYDFHTVDQAFKNYKGHRKGILKAPTHDVEDFRRQCDKCDVPGDEYLGLYAFPSGRWEINLSADVPKDFIHSRLYKFPKEETDKDAWEDLFSMINKLPTIYETVIGNAENQEVATENAKKRVKDKSTVSYHSSKKSKSNSEVQGMSSSRRVSTRKVLNSAKVTGDIGYKPIKDLKREGKKAITKRELPMQSVVQTRSKALGIQTRAQTRKSSIKKVS